MAGRRVNTYVHGVDAKGNSFVVGPDDTVTDEQAAAITNEDVWAADEADAPTDLGEAELGDRNADSRIVVTEGSQVVTAPEPREGSAAGRDAGHRRDVGRCRRRRPRHGKPGLQRQRGERRAGRRAGAAPPGARRLEGRVGGVRPLAWRGSRPNSMNRDDIIEAVDAGAGVPVEDEPDEGTED
jgi:hypothetical protein